MIFGRWSLSWGILVIVVNKEEASCMLLLICQKLRILLRGYNAVKVSFC